jgi:hypothetical protein
MSAVLRVGGTFLHHKDRCLVLCNYATKPGSSLSRFAARDRLSDAAPFPIDDVDTHGSGGEAIVSLQSLVLVAEVLAASSAPLPRGSSRHVPCRSSPHSVSSFILGRFPVLTASNEATDASGCASVSFSSLCISNEMKHLQTRCSNRDLGTRSASQKDEVR